jgi:putative addiction module component (TIGR02574 family)
MSMTKEQILEAAKDLDLDDRMDIADELFSSLTPAQRSKIDREWIEEIESRIEQIKSGKAKGIPADQALSQLRDKYRK